MERINFTCFRNEEEFIETSFDGDLTVSDMLEKFKCFLLGMGHHPNSVDKYIRDDGNGVIEWSEGYSGAQKYTINAGDVVIEEIRVKDGDATEIISDLAKLMNKSVRK